MTSGTVSWQEHVAAIERDGWLVTEYARLHDLPVTSLYYWRSKLRAMRAEPVGKFLTVEMEPVRPSASGACTLTLGSLRLEMPSLPSPEWLAAVAGAVAGAR
ncbi:MAG: hypothetical protein ABW202_23625 [Duganella sp.]